MAYKALPYSAKTRATAAMEAILRNVVRKKSFHFVHGAFSNRFFQTAQEIGINAICHESAWDVAVDWQNGEIDPDNELIAITHNETSTGVMWPARSLKELRYKFAEHLIAIDVTSSFGAMAFEWEVGDFWFSSVQKCLGLPSGLALLIVSPRGFEKTRQKSSAASWQKFEVMAKKMKTYQTVETPNMLGIALLAKTVQKWDLSAIEKEIRAGAELINKSGIRNYVKDSAWRSITVANLLVNSPKEWHQRVAKENIVLGKGYGPLKDSCIRIANFPATTAFISKLLL